MAKPRVTRSLVVIATATTLLSTAGILTGLPVPNPPSAPPVFTGNKTVNVAPGSGTLNAAVSSNGTAFVTYLLQAGTYTLTGTIHAGSHSQILGVGIGASMIKPSASGFDLFSVNGGTSNVQFWGFDIDCGGVTRSAIDAEGVSNLLIQQVHCENYASSIAGVEDFPLYLFSTNFSYGNVLIDSCWFTPSPKGNVDGTSVIATGALRPNRINYTNVVISNCTFDTPTDPGTLYYHCTGSATTISGCTFTAPSFSYGEFCYNEPGSWNGSSFFQDNGSNTTSLKNNNVVLANNYGFVGVGEHANGKSESFVITNNAISNGVIFRYDFKDAGYPKPCTPTVTIQHNTLTNTTLTGKVAAGDIGDLVTSPNR